MLDKKGKIALVVVNMPLDGMTVKFKKLWSTGQLQISVILIKKG